MLMLVRSWNAIRNQYRRRKRLHERFTRRRDLDTWGERWLGTDWEELEEETDTRLQERRLGRVIQCRRQIIILKLLQVMSVCVSLTLQTEFDEPKRGAGKRGRGNVGPSEQQGREETRQPPGIPNISGNCSLSAALHATSLTLGYNTSSGTTLWEQRMNWGGLPQV